MGEVSEEVELDLGLSIGRSFKILENLKPPEKGEKSDGFEADLSENSHAPPWTLDPQSKREIHALRRQEAKRKRDEKQEKKGRCRGRIGEMVGNGGSDDEKALQNQFPAKVQEIEAEEGQCKKNEIEISGSMNPNSNPGGSEQIGYGSSSPYPIMQMQFPYPPIQYVPLSNGFAIPYVVPCWAPNGPAAAGAQPVACRSFVPFQANLSSELNPANGCESDQNGSGGIRKATSNGSPMCSSSVVSDNRSSSHEGVTSNETRSHTSRSRPDRSQADGAKIQFQHTPSSNPMQGSSMSLHSNQQILGRDANAQIHIKKPNTSNAAVRVQAEAENKVPPPEAQKEANGETCKRNAQNQCLPQMPCVSATGNGPNGKTITGFLYRYTNAEVSIVCVCHGSSFSPAEFVAHAGGTDISNPLRHITVMPSAALG